jgi:hypothetical protein
MHRMDIGTGNISYTILPGAKNRGQMDLRNAAKISRSDSGNAYCHDETYPEAKKIIREESEYKLKRKLNIQSVTFPDPEPKSRIKEQHIPYRNPVMCNRDELYKDYDAVICVDEVGDLAKVAIKRKRKWITSKILGIGISVTHDPVKFIDAINHFKLTRNIQDEFKARKWGTYRKVTLGLKIHKSKTKTYGYYIDKTKDTPIGWMEQRGVLSQIAIIRQAIIEITDTMQAGKILVIIDRSRVYLDENPNFASVFSDILSRDTGKRMICMLIGNKKDPLLPFVETNDIVTRAIFDRITKRNPVVSWAIGQKIRRLGKNDDIRG